MDRPSHLGTLLWAALVVGAGCMADVAELRHPAPLGGDAANDAGTPDASDAPPSADGPVVDAPIEDSTTDEPATDVGVDAGPPCEVVGLIEPTTDPWDNQWDTIARPDTTFSEAEAACAAFGARLPTATELYRVRDGRAESILGSEDTTQLWTLAPASGGDQIVVRLSNGSAEDAPLTDPHAFRCLCPSPAPWVFEGKACSGPAQNECHPLSSHGALIHVDFEDRPSLTKAAAIWECGFVGASLISLPQAVESSADGVPGGGLYGIFLADNYSIDRSTIMTWTGVEPDWNISSGGLGSCRPQEHRRFRCAGVRTQNVVLSAVAGGFTPPWGGKTVDGADRLPESWVEAHDRCWAQGGHLARADELVEAIVAGLPNGSGAPLRTSDLTGELTVSTIQWDGISGRISYVPAGLMGETEKSSSTPFRCVYYAVDPSYGGPAAADCEGSCVPFELPGNAQARIWMDGSDRAPLRLASAFRECARVGGELATMRDMLEAIRRGLPNGTGQYLLTSEYGYNPALTVPAIFTLNWVGVDPSFDDTDPASVAIPQGGESRGFRCMWTNELR